MNKLTTILLWILQALLAFAFCFVGGNKVLAAERWSQIFRGWGYPDHFYLVVGLVEALGGLSLLVPRAAGYGAPAVMVIMVGALVHHLRRGEMQQVAAPVIFFLLLAIVAYARRPPFLWK